MPPDVEGWWIAYIDVHPWLADLLTVLPRTQRGIVLAALAEQLGVDPPDSSGLWDALDGLVPALGQMLADGYRALDDRPAAAAAAAVGSVPWHLLAGAAHDLGAGSARIDTTVDGLGEALSAVVAARLATRVERLWRTWERAGKVRGTPRSRRPA